MNSFYEKTHNSLKTQAPVSYTHLDVYKRQGVKAALVPERCTKSRMRNNVMDMTIKKLCL